MTTRGPCRPQGYVWRHPPQPSLPRWKTRLETGLKDIG